MGPAPREGIRVLLLIRMGFGIDGPPQYRVLPFLEARAVVHFTDYGSGGDFRLTRTGTPIMVGVRVRW